MPAHRSLDVEALKHIALLGAARGEMRMTSGTLAKALTVTQQAASNRLISLSDRGWISRRKAPRAQYVQITKEGKEILLGEYASYQQIFSPVSEVEFDGKVVSGMARGQYFLSLPLYRRQFEDFLGYTPYEGTLNIQVLDRDADKLSIIRGEEGHPIEGFTDAGNSFGAAFCFKAEVRGESGKSVDCALVLPSKSKYWDVVELVSKHHLRRTLKLKDGARVQVLVYL